MLQRKALLRFASASLVLHLARLCLQCLCIIWLASLRLPTTSAAADVKPSRRHVTADDAVSPRRSAATSCTHFAVRGTVVQACINVHLCTIELGAHTRVILHDVMTTTKTKALMLSLSP